MSQLFFSGSGVSLGLEQLLNIRNCNGNAVWALQVRGERPEEIRREDAGSRDVALRATLRIAGIIFERERDHRILSHVPG